jgi:hypothetical protein
MILFIAVFLFCGMRAEQAGAADPLSLTEIKGFSAGMTLDQVKERLSELEIPYDSGSDKPSILGWVLISVAECLEKGFFGACKKAESAFTIGGAEIDMLFYYPASKTIEFQFLLMSGSGIDHQRYSNAQTVVNSLLAQYPERWENTDVSCNQYGCQKTMSLHQGDGRFINITTTEDGMPVIKIGLSQNAGEADLGDF